MSSNNKESEALRDSAKNAYSQFEPRAYINEYYSAIGEENRFLLNFYHDVYSAMPQGISLLEFGGGPTVYQLFSASRKTTEIVFTDFLPNNLREVARWLEDDSGAFSWRHFSKVVAQLESGMPPEIIEERTRAVIKRVATCNALDIPAVVGAGRDSFDVVASGFCIECISSNEIAFKLAFNNVLKWLSPGGTFIWTLLKNSNQYLVGDKTFPAFPIDVDYVRATLEANRLQVQDLRETAAEHRQGYDGLIAVMARKT